MDVIYPRILRKEGTLITRVMVTLAFAHSWFMTMQLLPRLSSRCLWLYLWAFGPGWADSSQSEKGLLTDGLLLSWFIRLGRAHLHGLVLGRVMLGRADVSSSCGFIYLYIYAICTRSHWGSSDFISEAGWRGWRVCCTCFYLPSTLQLFRLYNHS